MAELETSSNEEKSKKLTEITRRKKNIEFRDRRIKILEKQKMKGKQGWLRINGGSIKKKHRNN